MRQCSLAASVEKPLLMIVFAAMCIIPLGACSSPLPLHEGDAVAHVNGIDLHHVVRGKGPVLVVHPGGPGFEWRYIRMPRVEQFATVVYLDPRGSGASSRLARLEDYRMDRMVEDLEALREHLGLERMALFGHSHGGMVAQLYALKHQARLRKLILSATVASTGVDWAAEMRRGALKRSGEKWYPDASAALLSGPASLTEDSLRSHFARQLPFYFHRWEPFRKQTLSLFDSLKMTVEPLRAFRELDAPVFDTRGRLGTLRVPTLITAGRHDFACSPESASGMNRLIQGSRLAVFEKSGHFPHIEEAEAYALTLRAFLMPD